MKHIDKNRLYLWVMIVLILATVAFIFSNSIADRETSSEQSSWVRKLIEPLLRPFVPGGEVTDHFVRKLAHFTEFALLGLELALLFRRLSLWPVFIALATALTDETIQIFSGRGPMVQDVWLDFAGALTGLACGLGGYALVRYLLRKKRKRTEPNGAK